MNHVTSRVESGIMTPGPAASRTPLRGSSVCARRRWFSGNTWVAPRLATPPQEQQRAPAAALPRAGGCRCRCRCHAASAGALEVSGCGLSAAAKLLMADVQHSSPTTIRLPRTTSRHIRQCCSTCVRDARYLLPLHAVAAHAHLQGHAVHCLTSERCDRLWLGRQASIQSCFC